MNELIEMLIVATQQTTAILAIGFAGMIFGLAIIVQKLEKIFSALRLIK